MVGTSLRMFRSKGFFLVGVLLLVGGRLGVEGRLGAPNRQLLTPGCGEGEFQKFYDGTCMTCDENCAPGKCVNAAGCEQCAKGYFKSRVDIFWPYACHKCEIENCDSCMENFFDDWEPKCATCLEGFVLNSNFTACEAEKKPAPVPKLVLGTTETRKPNGEDEEEVEDNITTSTTFKSNDDDEITTSKTFKSNDGDDISTSKTFKTRDDEISTSKTFKRTDDISTTKSTFINEVSTSKSTFKTEPDEITTTSTTKKTEEEEKKKKEVLGTTEERKKKKSEKCGKGSFLKEHDKTCMTCDPKCAANKFCVDYEGCEVCKPGYYKSRVDDFWPFECLKCVDKIPNCDVCKGGTQIYHNLGTTCLKCKKGFQIGQNGRACIYK